MSNPTTQETFSESDISEAIKQFLEYGEQTLVKYKGIGEPGHLGYYSGGGWAARCLRHHLQTRKTVGFSCGENA